MDILYIEKIVLLTFLFKKPQMVKFCYTYFTASKGADLMLENSSFYTLKYK